MSVSEMRRQRKAKIAARQAETIVEQATERVKASSRALPSQEPTPALVKEMRDQRKMTWMAIGKELGLPGAKFGAGTARRLYAEANSGVVPRKYAPRKGSKPKPEGPATSGTITSRKEKLVKDGHVIPRSLTDEEVEAMLVGRKIEWAIDLAALTETDPDTWGPEDKRWLSQEARVHVTPDYVKVVSREDEGKDRVVYFREYGGRDDRGQHMSGPTRCVRVDAIFTVR